MYWLNRAGAGFVLSLFAVAMPRLADAASAPFDSVPMATGPLSLPRALALTASHPGVRAADLRSRAATTRLPDSDRRPNPELTGAVEDFGGGLGEDRRETTLELSQTLELGGDRGARTAIATGEQRLAAADAAVLRRDVQLLTAERFIRAWALQARVARLLEGEALTRQSVRAADERFRAGAALELERTRAENRALAQAVTRQRTETELAVARRELALCWGQTAATFDSLVADSTFGPAPDPRSPSVPRPELERAGAQEELASARLRLAEAARVPDLTFSGGVRRLEEADATGFVAAAQLPLPLWSRGKATVSALHEEQAAATSERQAMAQRLDVERAGELDRLRAAVAVHDTLRGRLLPMRRRLIDELLGAYRAGRLGYLDLIAEQAALLDTQLDLIEAEADLWRSRMRVTLLTGWVDRLEDHR